MPKNPPQASLHEIELLAYALFACDSSLGTTEAAWRQANPLERNHARGRAREILAELEKGGVRLKTSKQAALMQRLDAISIEPAHQAYSLVDEQDMA